MKCPVYRLSGRPLLIQWLQGSQLLCRFPFWIVGSHYYKEETTAGGTIFDLLYEMKSLAKARFFCKKSCNVG